jgi:hypothetical protein
MLIHAMGWLLSLKSSATSSAPTHARFMIFHILVQSHTLAGRGFFHLSFSSLQKKGKKGISKALLKTNISGMRLGHQGDLAVALSLPASDIDFSQGQQTLISTQSTFLQKKFLDKKISSSQSTRKKRKKKKHGLGPPPLQVKVQEIAFNEETHSMADDSGEEDSRSSRDGVSYSDTLFTTGSLLYNISHPLANKRSALPSDSSELDSDDEKESQENTSITELDSLTSKNSLKAYFPEMHTITEKSLDYPPYLRYASPEPPKYPSRREWIPLKPTTAQKVNGWMVMLKRMFTTRHHQSKKEEEDSDAVMTHDQKTSTQKTGWSLSETLQRHRSKTFTFQKNPVRSSSFLQRISQKSSITDRPETSSETSSRTTVVSRHQKASPTPIRFCNQYVKVEGDAWVFLHRDPQGNVLGAYQIKSSFI